MRVQSSGRRHQEIWSWKNPVEAFIYSRISGIQLCSPMLRIEIELIRWPSANREVSRLRRPATGHHY